jgi:hypothetical protein
MKDTDWSSEDVQISPLLELELIDGQFPQPHEVLDHGITIDGSRAVVPLSPVKEYGNTVALLGRMFYPGSIAVNVAASATLGWQVQGETEIAPVIMLRSKETGLYLSQWGTAGTHIAGAMSKTIYAVKDTADSRCRLQMEYLGNNEVAFRSEESGLYLSEWNVGGNYKIWVAKDAVDRWCRFELEYLGNNQVAIKSTQRPGWYWSVWGSSGHHEIWAAKGALDPYCVFEIMDSTGSTFFPVEDAFVNKNIGDTQLSEEYFKQTRVLAKYREPFQLTGYSVEEHLGCDAGVFYSENSTQTVTLQTALPFLYLESQTPLSDIRRQIIRESALRTECSIQ